jgi:hypothetical protein
VRPAGTLLLISAAIGSGRHSRSGVLAVVAKSDPEHLLIKAPVRIEQGEANATVFMTFTDQLVTAYTDSGLKVTYTTYPGVSHGGVVDAGAKDATSDIRTRLK